MQGRLLQLGREFGLDEAHVAEVTGLAPARVRALERGRVKPTLADLLAVADAFGVSVDWLLGRGEPKWGPRLERARQALLEHLEHLSPPGVLQLMSATTAERIAYVIEQMRLSDSDLLQEWYAAGWIGLSKPSAARLLGGELDATTPVVARVSALAGLPETWVRTGDPKSLRE